MADAPVDQPTGGQTGPLPLPRPLTLSRPPALSRPLWRLGTSGYSYRDWLGNFFPRSLPQGDWLAWYAERLNAVEINSTFHAAPPLDRFQHWRDVVPAEFRFSVKVPREISHDTPPARAVDKLMHFAALAQAGLGDRLGCLLLQFPPHIEAHQQPAIDRMIRSIRQAVPLVVEFRSNTWNTPDTVAWLSELQTPLVAVDHEDHPSMSRLVVTGPLLYIRLVGKHGRYQTEDHERFDPTEQLVEWHARIAEALASPAGAHCQEVWVLFNNDYAGHAPTTLSRFARIAGMPAPEFGAAAAPAMQQKRLFDL